MTNKNEMPDQQKALVSKNQQNIETKYFVSMGEKSKSLWKDVREFKLNDLKHYLLKRKSGEIIIFLNDYSGLEYLAKFDEDKLKFSEFCSMNDIIEAFENLQKDVEEIKRKIK